MKRPAAPPHALPRVPRAARALALAGVVAALVGGGGCSVSSDSVGADRDGGTAADGGIDAPGDAGGKAGAAGNVGAGGRGVGGRSGAAGAGGSGAPSGTGGSASGAGGATGAAGAGAQGPCFVTFEIRSPQLTSTNFEVGPDVRVRVRGAVFNSKSAAPKLTWTITSPAGGALMTAIEGENEVSFQASMIGVYTIGAQVDKEPECSAFPRGITGVRPSPAFNVRVTAKDYPVTEKLIRPPISELALPLDPGGAFQIEPRAQNQPAVMPAYLRITGVESGLSIEGSTSRGALQARLLTEQLYDLLIVPDDPSYAPDLVTAKPSAWSGAFMVDPGTPIVGLVLGPDDAPLEGARMLLKRGGRPSTIGTSDRNGMLSLRTRPGVMSAVVVPPAGSGLPQATVPANSPDAGLNLTSAMSSLSLTTRFQAIAQGPLTLTILDPAGGKPVSGARVRIASHAELPAVAILTARGPEGADVQLPAASGSVNAEVLSDAAGRASFGRVPATTYDVLVTPPAGSSLQALTSVAVELQAGGVVPAAAATITLATKVPLTGTLSPAADAVGASITAVDMGADGSGGVTSALVDSLGRFTLAVSPNRSYRIIAQPATQGTSIRTVFSVSNVGVGTDGKATTPPALMLKLQRGRPLSGSVKNAEGGAPVGQAFIQIFCVSSVPSCVDPTLSLAETTSRGDGSFSLLIPDPDP